MRRSMAAITAAAMLVAAAPQAVPVAAAENKPTIYIAGDSTAQTYKDKIDGPQRGWGQVFGDFFTDEINVVNRAIGGRSTIRYIKEGRLEQIHQDIKPGDYLFVQFGINDATIDTPEKYIDVPGYKALLRDEYIGKTEQLGATPILMTPSAGCYYDEKEGRFRESRIEYANATRDLAAEIGCKFIDINRIMTQTYNTMDKDEVISGYLLCEPLESVRAPEGKNDYSHFKEKGARLVAKLITEAIPECVPELSRYIKRGDVFHDIQGHWAEQEIKYALEKGFIQDDRSGAFRPDAEVTRGEFLKMVMIAAEIPTHGFRPKECLEAEDDEKYRYYIQGALDRGLIPVEMTNSIIKPVTKTLVEADGENEAVTLEMMSYTCGFRADWVITREEMAAIAINCLLCAENKLGERSTYLFVRTFKDTDISPWCESYVEEAASHDLITGDKDGYFYPQQPLTRVQAVVIANRISRQIK
ncbi:MAG: S-layer homology domain-containing protein [Clostridia bacterium]|nr:S-layer homology domain-containing protein [Clostridia bacterium]